MTKPTFQWTMNTATTSEANCSEHWSVKSKRHRQQQQTTRFYFSTYVPIIKLPCHIHLVRLSPRTLDDDNLRTALKYIRDELSDLLIPPEKNTYVTKFGKRIPLKGRQDSHRDLSWSYNQQKSPTKGVQVSLFMDEIPEFNQSSILVT
jgi:hypothetical protein